MTGTPTAGDSTPTPVLSVPVAGRAGNSGGTSHRPAVWWGVLAVAVCGVVATAHGLFAVAVACGVSPPMGCLYVPITDGLALVAYAATSRLTGWDRGYAWLVVVVAAGLSGLAQAVNLAGLGEPDWRLKFGVGYWPAVAVAVAAHLLWLVSRPAVGPTVEPVRLDLEPVPPTDLEPVGEPAVEPAVVHAEPASEPRLEPAADPAARTGSTGGEPLDQGRLKVVGPSRKRPAQRGPSKPSDPRVGQRFECPCCGRMVSRMTLDRHAEQAAQDAAELTERAQLNGHSEPVSVR